MYTWFMKTTHNHCGRIGSNLIKISQDAEITGTKKEAFSLVGNYLKKYSDRFNKEASSFVGLRTQTLAIFQRDGWNSSNGLQILKTGAIGALLFGVTSEFTFMLFDDGEYVETENLRIKLEHLTHHEEGHHH
eukprot:TRINITY_DN11429_c0_g1_i1.p1 TRINITY_DN11429_c0_g1~~TRINITY_DN11429_c0_g1_i1.p1  ORF type:complete len:147 (+),score=24.38 TRINITY_DN11429_c0_g1_i1:48-443(+)